MAESSLAHYRDSDRELEWAVGNAESSQSANVNARIGAVVKSDTPTDGNSENADKTADFARATSTAVSTCTVPMAMTISEIAERRQRRHKRAQQ